MLGSKGNQIFLSLSRLRLMCGTSDVTKQLPLEFEKANVPTTRASEAPEEDYSLNKN